MAAGIIAVTPAAMFSMLLCYGNPSFKVLSFKIQVTWTIKKKISLPKSN